MVNITLKERETGQVFIQGSGGRVKVKLYDIVSVGAKFRYSRILQLDGPLHEERITSKGPLLRPIVVFSTSQSLGATYKAKVEFTVSAANDPLSSRPAYHWVIRGWSKCSQDCDGGTQHLILR